VRSHGPFAFFSCHFAEASTPEAASAGSRPTSQTDCDFRHEGMKDRLLGVSAIQLSLDLPGMNLSTLIAEGLLSVAGRGRRSLPR